MLRLQKAILALILLTLGLPVPALIAVSILKPQGKWVDLALSRTLVGVTMPQQDVAFTRLNLLNGAFQKSFGDWVNQHFAFREMFIRSYNQLLWSIFGKSYMAHESVIEGKAGWLFEDIYLEDYDHRNSADEKDISLFCDDLVTIKRNLAKAGVSFVVLVTPSKAVFCSDYVPDRYSQNARSDVPRDYDILIKQLRLRGIPLVDGHELTKQAVAVLPVRVFPKLGIHWCWQTAYFTAEEFLRKSEQLSGKHLTHLKMGPITINEFPELNDEDLAGLLNLDFPLHARSMHSDFLAAEGSPKKAGRLTVIGGSFVGQLITVWFQAEAWEKINYYYYYSRIYRYPAVAGESGWVGDPNTAEWQHDIYNADVVALELNEAYIASHRDHANAFVNAFLKQLSPVSAAK